LCITTKATTSRTAINGTFPQFNKWFEVNTITLYLAKKTKLPTIHMYLFKLGYGIKTIKEIPKYPEMGTHFENVIPKCNSACTAMRAGTSLMTTDTLKLITFLFSEP
jgi:hypothetical protein